ncbi:MAG TPA: biotin/lipoyl-containing protein [Anaerolineales bacterium]|nr:biotin/lipoyl-containing protein [Anaerolineales bacterium]
MAIYRISIGENEYRIEITEKGVTINGEPIEADLVQLNETGLYLMNHEEDKVELHLRFEGDNSYLVMADGQQIKAQIESDMDQVRGSKTRQAENELRAPMPGLVISVNVQVGDQVEEGQVVCVLESMKMQMAIHAPKTGTVQDVAIKPDERVEKDALLAIVE